MLIYFFSLHVENIFWFTLRHCNMALETRIHLDDLHVYIDLIEYPLNVQLIVMWITSNCNSPGWLCNCYCTYVIYCDVNSFLVVGDTDKTRHLMNHYYDTRMRTGASYSHRCKTFPWKFVRQGLLNTSHSFEFSSWIT